MTPRSPAFVRIDGTAVDPCIVVSGASRATGSEHRIELQLSASVLLHELQEGGVAVSAQTLRDFLATDAHDERGRAAYLTIFRSSHSTSTPRWRWVESSDVQIHNGLVTFCGAVIEYDTDAASSYGVS